MTRRPWTLLLASTLACLTVAGSAHAGDSRPEAKAADDLYKSAKAAMDRGDLLTACTEFAESEKLDPAVGTLLNLGVCESKLGKYAQAYNHVQEARGKLPVGDYRIAFADQKLADLSQHVAHLSVRAAPGSPASVHLVRDDVELTPNQYGVSVVVDPGAHVCVARAQGRTDTRVEFTLQEGESRSIELAAGPRADDTGGGATKESAAPASASDSGASNGASPSTPGNSRRTWGLVLGTAGVVGLGVGVAAALTAKGTYNDALTHCPSGANSCDGTGVSEGQDAHGQATIATIAFIGGAALVATGAVLLLTGPKNGAVSVAPAVGANTAGLTLRGGW
jgi:hypothetical protein